jgi:arylsulfatase A-like enzyme
MKCFHDNYLLEVSHLTRKGGNMEKKNIILITMDEVRADHLSCYGHRKIKTKNIDAIASEGVRFETCIASSILTPVSHASILSGLNPYSHGVRGPFDRFASKSLPQILKNSGYRTAGFVGNSMLGERMGFSRGFDYFDEPKVGDRFMWEIHSYNDPEHPDIRFPWGNWWIQEMIQWIEDNLHDNFFVFGHFFHTHEGSERQLMEMGLIERDCQNSEFGFYDEKIRLCDKHFIGPIIEVLKKNGIYNDTTIVITADHGTMLGERPLPPIPWRNNVFYPQHSTMYEPDIRVPCIIKDRDLPVNITVRDNARSIDLLPTLLSLAYIELPPEVEGVDLCKIIHGEKIPGFKAYIEDLFLLRGLGALQAIRTETCKYIKNRTSGKEEFYDILSDPNETENRIDSPSGEEREFIYSCRKEIERYYSTCKQVTMSIEEKEKEEIMERLRALGYV